MEIDTLKNLVSLVESIELEIERLNWSRYEKWKYLHDNYQKNSIVQLTTKELIEILCCLKLMSH